MRCPVARLYLVRQQGDYLVPSPGSGRTKIAFSHMTTVTSTHCYCAVADATRNNVDSSRWCCHSRQGHFHSHPNDLSPTLQVRSMYVLNKQSSIWHKHKHRSAWAHRHLSPPPVARETIYISKQFKSNKHRSSKIHH